MKFIQGQTLRHFVIVASLLFLFPLICSAERVLSEKEILARCYAQLTGQKLGNTDPLWGQLATSDGASICLSLFDQVQLGQNGVLTSSANPVYRRILKQFHDFHRDWFPLHWSYLSSFPDQYYGTVDIYDGSEPSLYITRSLFSQAPLPYSSALTGYQSLSAIRDASTVNPGAIGASKFLRPTKSFYVGEDTIPDDFVPSNVMNMAAVAGQDAKNNYFSIAAPIVQIGQLIGIQPAPDASTSSLWVYNFTTQANANGDINKPQSFHQHYGGGALGSAPFIMMNLGQDFTYTANGGTKLPRRAMMTAFNTFLCLSGPFTRETDVGSYYVDPTKDPNGAAFRHSTSCLRCHATLDRAGMTMRNLRLGSSANVTPKVTRLAAMVVSSPADMGAANPEWPSAPNATYYRTTPTGHLFFRSETGVLVDQNVQNLDGLGRSMAATDDYYACAAKRYFQYFTGVNVTLFDPYDIANSDLLSAMTPKDAEYRNYVLALGKELKSTGSLRTLVHRIISSDYYRLVGFGR
jgi:hypothetical protein